MEMLSLLSLTIFFVNLFLLSYIAASRSYTCFYARRLQYYDEKKLLQSEIQTFTNVTKIKCSSVCGRQKFCLSFLFYSDVPKCVTLRERFEHFMVTSTAVSAFEFFQTDKPLATVGSDCELDVDCMSLVHAHCLQGSCRCKAGHRLGVNICRNFTELCASSPGYSWDADTDMCYRIETRERKNWTDAERSCIANQGHLLKPDTQAKNEKMRTLLEPSGIDTFWFGVRNNLEWQWLNNTPVTSPDWEPGEPSGDGSCAHFYRPFQYKWNDRPCSSLGGYVCEIPLN